MYRKTISFANPKRSPYQKKIEQKINRKKKFCCFPNAADQYNQL